MIDTPTLTGIYTYLPTSKEDVTPRDRDLAEKAWIWIEDELNSAEEFDFLFVAGHYEIVSSPGKQDMALYERLLPMMTENKATAYLQGHRIGFYIDFDYNSDIDN